MRASLGNSMLLSIVIVFISLIILVFIGVLSYSKAYRVKNGVIEILERYDTYDPNNAAENDAIRQYLKQVGYQIGSCSSTVTNNMANTGYKLCIEKLDSSDGGYRFKVTAYVEYNFPIVNTALSTPISGETRILGTDYNIKK